MTDSMRVSTGVPGLDRILRGGLLPGRGYLVRGGPGTGKTTLGLHFLAAGAETGESALFVTLGEPGSQIEESGNELGLDSDSIHFLDLSPGSDFFTEGQSYDIFSPADVEGATVSARIAEAVDELDPDRVCVDSMTQLRHLTSDPYHFRKQVLSFLRFLVERGITVLVLSEASSNGDDEDLQFMVDGVIDFSLVPEGRFVAIRKLRGSGFQAGRHGVRLSDTGMHVYPRLVPGEHTRDSRRETIPMGISAMDELLHGGLERGTVTLISGPTGVGKTSLGMQFAKEAARRGERTVVYLFEEQKEILVRRCESINIPVRRMAEEGRLEIEYVEPLHYAVDEFAERVRHEVEEKDTRIVLLDSVSGYQLALGDSDRNLATSLHALCKYLTNMGVAVVITNETHSITGQFRATDSGISFLADNIVILRYFETNGHIHKAIGVLKKRLSGFEQSLRALEIGACGIKVGPPLKGLRGILSGAPVASGGGSAVETAGGSKV